MVPLTLVSGKEVAGVMLQCGSTAYLASLVLSLKLFLHGMHLLRHGKGVQIWPDGARYEGDWAEDKDWAQLHTARDSGRLQSTPQQFRMPSIQS